MGQQTINMITPSELLPEVIHLKNDGYRLVAISCTRITNQELIEDGKDMELTYSFDLEYEFINLRIITDTKEDIQSISVIYPYSFLYENEIKELFGVKIKDISIDFHNALYKIPVKTPFGEQKEDK